MDESTTEDAAAGFGRGVEHLQTAAHELLFAARSFLDVVEDVVSDREKLEAVTTSLSEVLGAAGSSLASAADRATRAANRPGDDRAQKPGNEGGERPPRVRRITLDE